MRITINLSNRMNRLIQIIVLTSIILGTIGVFTPMQPVAAGNTIRHFYAPFNDQWSVARPGPYGGTARASANKYNGYLEGYVSRWYWGKSDTDSRINVKDVVPYDSYLKITVGFQLDYYARATNHPYGHAHVYVWVRNSEAPWGPEPLKPGYTAILYERHVYGLQSAEAHIYTFVTVDFTQIMQEYGDYAPQGKTIYHQVQFMLWVQNAGYIQYGSWSSSNARCDVNWINIEYIPI